MTDHDNGKRGGWLFAFTLKGHRIAPAQIMNRAHKLADFYRTKGYTTWATGFIAGAMLATHGMLTSIALSALCLVVAAAAALVLWALAGVSKMQDQQQDDTEAYLRLTTDFDRRQES